MTNVFEKIWIWLNTNTFVSIVMVAITIILAFSLLRYTIRLLSNIRGYILNKSNAIKLENEKSQNTIPSLTITERVEITNSILDLISFMIANEIVVHFKNYAALHLPYDVSNLDNDVKTISEKVYDGINKDIFADPNLILTNKYLLEYITKKTITSMIDVIQTHNDNIRGNNKSAEN